MNKPHPFQPGWRTRQPLEKSWRSIFKWGAPDQFKHPNAGLYTLLKNSFGLDDADFKTPQREGDETVLLGDTCPPQLTDDQVKTLENIVGKENITGDDYSRVKFSYGKTMEEIYDLRDGNVDHLCDLVIHPRDAMDVQNIVRFANQENIPVYVFGGGSSVTLGLRPIKGGITLVMSTHMNRILEFNETNQTVTVESGMMGPDFEKSLNRAPSLFKAGCPYTCGHFPQSFEFSSVGGWIVTKGSGQMSSYYGDACDLVVSQEYVTPTGSFKTHAYPATATGPLVNDIMKGSEGSFGILVSVTLKIFRFMPGNRKKFSFIFPDWEHAVKACRDISQGEFGMPSVLRISDPEETFVGLKQHGIEGGILDTYITARGYKGGQRCLMIGHTEGEKNFSHHVYRTLKKICKTNQGLSLTGYPVTKWEKGKYSDPYMREDLNDFGIVIDTLETGVSWDNLMNVHEKVRAFVKSRPQTLCLTHCSHFYPQGTNLYFIFIGQFSNRDEYKTFQENIIDHIETSGGSLSHHHGVGKMIAPFMERHLGKEQMAVLKGLKNHFDPRGIMNPGGTLGLD
ncbi:MAG: FAD-binding oxidoreductase [Proteobacteria bacterium]|nr:FAD-binding oxidoreductase [Pseudomonadota bacterium]